MLSVTALEGIYLTDAFSGQQKIFLRGDSPYTMVVFLSPGDCPNCLTEKSVWEEFSQNYKSKIHIIGIIIRSSPNEAKTFSKAFNFSFETLFDKDKLLEKRTSLPSVTPFKVLIGKSGDVILADGPNPTSLSQKEFKDKLIRELN